MISIFRSLFLVALIASPALYGQTVINVTSFGAAPDSGQDATPAFRAALAAAKASGGPVTLHVPPGRYDFALASATVRNCHTSNSTESGSPQRHIALDLIEINDLTIEGPGATLMMGGQMTMLVAERCENLTLRGLEFDFERPTFSELTALSKDSNSWIGQVHPDSDYQIVNGNRLHWIGPGMGTGFDQIQRYYHSNGSVFRNNASPIGSPAAIEDLGGGTLKFTGGNLGNVEVGVTYQFRIARRNEVGMWFNRCKDVTVEDVAVRAMHGFGILAQFTENVTYKRLAVAPKPGSGRTCASPADITHFSGCKGTIKLHDCFLSAAHDDAMNVHGTHLRIVSQPAPNKLRLQFKHHQTWGFQPFIPGDAIELVKAGTLLAYDSANVTGVDKVSDHQWDITLDKNVTVQAINSDVVENVTWTPAVEVINCDLIHLSCRGLLLTTRKPVLVQGNRFYRTSMHGILIEDDANAWFESGPIHDLTIRGNTFYYCAESVVEMDPQHTGDHAGPVHKNIHVEDNDFFLKGNGAAYAKSIDNLRFAGNRFHMGNGSSPAASALVGTSNTTNLSFADNSTGPASAPSLVLANGDFEADDPPSGAVASWFASVPVGAKVINDSGSRVLALAAGTAIYQNLGAFDRNHGNSLRLTFDQLASAGPVVASLLVWDGRLAPADGVTPTALKIHVSRTFPATTSAAAARIFTADLSPLPVGTRLWLCLAAPSATTRVDSLALAQSAPPDAATFGGWMELAGVVGADALPAADPDHDGIPNLIEYVLQETNPLRPDTAPLRAMFVPGNNKPSFRYHPRTVADVLVAAEYQVGGLSPGGWQPVSDGDAGLAVRRENDDSVWIEVVDTIAEKLFVRLSATAAPAPPPVVANAGFESPDRTGLNPAHSSGTPQDWTFAGTSSSGVEEIRDSRFGSAGPEGSRLDALGGAGDQVGFINVGNTASGSGSATSAVLGNVAPSTTYTLTIAFGQRVSGDRHPDGSFGLSAGNTAVGNFTTFAGVSLATGFTQKTYTWTSPSLGDPLIGKPLQIRMNFSYSAAGGWRQAQFDNVRLTSQPAK
ncbi:MAG: right-handed parallel beta-helix repeat-containing protein [Verrucomicrobiota bacterium]